VCCVVVVRFFSRFSLTITRWLVTSTIRRSEPGKYTNTWDVTYGLGSVNEAGEVFTSPATWLESAPPW
jgi:hypothetical protein